MASLRSFFRDVASKTIVEGTVAVVLLVAGVVGAWLLGVLPLVWATIVAALALLGTALVFAVPIPVWLLLLVILPLIYLTLRSVQRQKEARRAQATAESAARDAEMRAELAERRAEDASARAAQLAHPITLGDPQPAPLQLEQLELRIVEVLARADGAWLTMDEFIARLGKARLLIDQSLDKLKAENFLAVVAGNPYTHPATSYRLSPTGRDFAIQKGFVRT